MNFGEAILGAAMRTALEHCDETSGSVDVSVAYSAADLERLGPELILDVPRRMEKMIRSLGRQDVWLPTDFFRYVNCEESSGFRIFRWHGRVCETKRSEELLYRVMRERANSDRDRVEMPDINRRRSSDSG